MIHTSRHLPRRTFLRGLGATIALPFLDGMVPAFAAAPTPVQRLGVVYVPNGMNMPAWTPSAVGSGFEFTRILEPLQPFRDQLLVLTGLDNGEAEAREGEGTGDHSRAQAAFLTGVHARKTEGADIQNGMSMDQILAKELGKQTQLASLELALEANEIAGSGEDGYSAAYSGTLAWRSPRDPLPAEADPRAVFERLFGASGSTDRQERLERLRRDRSILDSIGADLASFKTGLSAKDRTKVAEYLDSIRDIERRLQLAEQQSDQELPAVDRPAGIPDSLETYGELMYDLLALAYQTDLTRVGTFLVAREKSGRAYPEAGVPESHHPISHHQNRPDLLEKLAKINTFHTKQFAHFLEKLRATSDGDGSLLDHSVILYGSGMSDGDGHFHRNVPLLMAGGGAGRVQGGRHLRFAKGTPLTNLYLTLLNNFGVRMERLGDSSGELNFLSGI